MPESGINRVLGESRSVHCGIGIALHRLIGSVPSAPPNTQRLRLSYPYETVKSRNYARFPGIFAHSPKTTPIECHENAPKVALARAAYLNGPRSRGSVPVPAQRARDIIQGLRRFLTEGQPKREAVRVKTLVEKVPELIRHDLDVAGVTLTLDLPKANLTIRGERLLLQQVLLILVTNAIEASPARGTSAVIRIRVRARGRGGVRVSVCDQGQGITRGKRFNLFDPFQSTKAGGMGMGLAIARRVILAHGGQISLRSQEGQGTVASFWVPGEQPHGGRR